MTNHIQIKDSTSNETLESMVIRFFDYEYNITKMQNAVYATINNSPVTLTEAITLFKKKELIKQFKSLQGTNPLAFRSLIETPMDNVLIAGQDMDYIFQLHKNCPGNQYLCLFFFNTVVIDETSYAYDDCEDIFQAHAESNIQTYTLCYLKRTLTKDKLATIIQNANTLGLNTHIAISSYKRPRRITENLYGVSSIIIDLDYYKTDYAEIDNYTDFRQALQPILDTLGIEPSAITYSGHGYYLTFNLTNNVNLKYSSMHWLYQSVVQKLIEKFVDFGADYACSDLTRVFKIPGSINFKTGIPVTLCHYNPAHTINLSELADRLGIHTRAENKSRENAIAYQKYYFGNNSRFSNANKQRMEDYEHLLHSRNYKLPHKRDLFFLFVAVNCFNMSWSATSILSYCKQLNTKLQHPLIEKELEHLIYYLNNQLNEDGSCKLKYKNDYIVRTLGISDNEQKHMHQLISCKTRTLRKKAWDKANARYKVLETKRKNDELYNTLMYYRYCEFKTNSEIAKELDIDIRTVTSRINVTPEHVKLQNALLKKEHQHYIEESTCYEIHLLQKQQYTTQQIASLLNLSVRSVQRYLSIIKKNHSHTKCC